MARIYTVGQVNTYIRTMFQQDFVLQKIQISGEVSNCKYHTSGHIYFSLKDETGNLACVMFAGNRTTGLKFRLQNGQQVVVTGQITVYERDGKYQLYAKKIEQQGQGALYERFLKRKEELEEMGMFAQEYKQPIPRYAMRVGIVTAPTGAAVRDIIQIAGRRNPYVQLILRPAIVQGEYAQKSICEGIEELDELGVDVIIVGRGGGSLEDLWAFNEEAVARAVFFCRTPVISAVGHETDFTITDFVADLRAPTPSAAAELAVWEWSQTEEKLLFMERKLREEMEYALERQKNRVRNYSGLLQGASPQNRLREKQIRMDHIQDQMQKRMADRIREAKRRKETDAQLLNGEMERSIRENRHRLQIQIEKMNGLSPIRRLNQGLAVLEKEKERISSVSQIRPGDQISIYVADGKITATAEKTESYPAQETLTERGTVYGQRS